MSERPWTKEQKKAIDCEGSNILVSAGAGSGKTAVLTQRVTRKLLSGVGLNNLLVLTFTNAAAKEMKMRIRKSIKNNEELKLQLDYIDTANITTFDAYALSIVKKYHYLLNISKDIKIVDKNIIDIQKKEILDRIMDELYEKKEKSFTNLIYAFCLKNDKKLKESILRLKEQIDLLIDKNDFFINYEKRYLTKERLNKDYETYWSIINDKLTEMIDLYDEIEGSLESDKDYEHFASLSEHFYPLINARNYNEVLSFIDFSLSGGNLKINQTFSTCKTKMNGIKKDLKEILYYESEAQIRQLQSESISNIKEILKITKRLDEEIQKHKIENELFEFNDISKLAIEILINNPQIRDDIKYSLNEILLDEYQDTSDLQENFISLIANNNVYMVGDVKQSIYRFRNANPKIFIQKYESYLPVPDESNTDTKAYVENHPGYVDNSIGVKIDLNDNFRSRKEVLNDINTIFSNIMSSSIGGANYAKDHIIKHGNKMYDLEGNYNQDNNLQILLYEKQKKDSDFKPFEIEAFTIAKDIKEKIENGYMIYDKDSKDEKIRKIRYEDITILLDRATKFETYKKIFEYFLIPLVIEKNENVKNYDDILTLKNLFNIIYKMNLREIDESFKLSFIGVARSFLFELPDRDIFEIINEKKFFNNEIYYKLEDVISNVEHLSIKTIMQKLLDKTDFYFKLTKNSNVSLASTRVNYLIKIIDSLENKGYELKDLVGYFKKINEENFKVELPTIKESISACKMMTIHKSKGLEFPICYYAGLNTLFNKTELNEKILFSVEEGIVIPFNNGIRMPNIKKINYKKTYFTNEISEKIRLFYVALSRAKEKMIIVMPYDNKKNIEQINDQVKMKYHSFAHMINSLYNPLVTYIKDVDLEQLGLTQNYKFNNQVEHDKQIKNTDILIEKISLKMNEKEIKTTSFSKKEFKIIDEKTSSMIERGNKLHDLIYIIDFKEKDMQNYNLSHDDIIIIERLFNSFLFENISAAKIYKEHEFIYFKDGEERHGIIDLILEYDDHIKIIDYKLMNIDDLDYDKQLKGYKEYICSISEKQVKLYLYSLIDGISREVK